MKPKRPRDTNQLAKFIVDRSVGEVQEPAVEDEKPAASIKHDRDEPTKASKS
jgi:glucose dehydrogenase